MTAPAPRALSYSRGSTADQAPKTQANRLRAVAAQMGLDLPEDRVLVDDGVSGRTMDRPAFDQVRDLVRERAVDVVLTTKLDRLGRSARGVLEFFELAESCGVRVVCADQSIDTATPLGRFTRTIAAAFAELEGDMIRERTRDRLNALSERHRKTGEWDTKSGRPVGRPPRLTPELLAEIVRLRDGEGRRWSQVALRVHAPAGSCRKWYSAFRAKTGGPIGRNKIVTPGLAAEIARLRESGLRWSQVSARVGHPADSCMKWYAALRIAKSRAINGG